MKVNSLAGGIMGAVVVAGSVVAYFAGTSLYQSHYREQQKIAYQEKIEAMDLEKVVCSLVTQSTPKEGRGFHWYQVNFPATIEGLESGNSRGTLYVNVMDREPYINADECTLQQTVENGLPDSMGIMFKTDEGNPYDAHSFTASFTFDNDYTTADKLGIIVDGVGTDYRGVNRRNERSYGEGLPQIKKLVEAAKRYEG